MKRVVEIRTEDCLTCRKIFYTTLPEGKSAPKFCGNPCRKLWLKKARSRIAVPEYDDGN